MERLAKTLAKASESDGIRLRYQFAAGLKPNEWREAVAAAYAHPSLKYYAQSLLAFWAERDFGAMRAWYEGLSTQMSKDLTPAFITAFTTVDPGGALNWLENSSPEVRSALMNPSLVTTLAHSVGLLEPDRLARMLMPVGAQAPREGPGQFKSPELGTELNTLFSELAKRQPAESAARALALPPGRIRTEAVVAVAKTWAETDPEAAKAWADRVQDAALGEQVTAACALGMAATRPEEAIAWMNSQPATANKTDNMRQIFSRWADFDPEAALAWIDAQPKDAGMDEYLGAALNPNPFVHGRKAMQLISDRLAAGKSLGFGTAIGLTGYTFAIREGPDSALDIASGPLAQAPGDVARVVWQGLVSGAAETDPEKAAAWAARQPEGYIRRSATDAIASKWEMSDLPGALTWAKGFPRSEDYDSARTSIGNLAAADDLQGSIEIINGVTDPEEKTKWQRSAIFRAWKSDRSETEAWVTQTAALTAEEKATAKANIARWAKETR